MIGGEVTTWTPNDAAARDLTKVRHVLPASAADIDRALVLEYAHGLDKRLGVTLGGAAIVDALGYLLDADALARLAEARSGLCWTPSGSVMTSCAERSGALGGDVQGPSVDTSGGSGPGSAGGEVIATRMRGDDPPGQPEHDLNRPCRSWSRPTASNGRASPRAGAAGGSCAPGRVVPDCGTLAGYSARTSSTCSRTNHTCLGDSSRGLTSMPGLLHPPVAGCRSPAGPSRAIGPIGSRRLTWKHQGPWPAGTLARPGRPLSQPSLGAKGRAGGSLLRRALMRGGSRCLAQRAPLRPVPELGGLNASAVSESHALESRLSPCE